MSSNGLMCPVTTSLQIQYNYTDIGLQVQNYYRIIVVPIKFCKFVNERVLAGAHEYIEFFNLLSYLQGLVWSTSLNVLNPPY